MQWLRKRTITFLNQLSWRGGQWEGSIKFVESIYMNFRFTIADLPRRNLASIDIDPLSKHRNSRLAAVEGAVNVRVAFNSGQSIERKNKWALSREEKEERRSGDGCARSRTRGERVIAVAFFFEYGSNVFVRELGSRGEDSRTHTHVSASSVSPEEATTGKRREKERKKQPGIRKLRGTPTGQPTRSKGRNTSHIGFSRSNAAA